MFQAPAAGRWRTLAGMNAFTHQASPVRVVFGAGVLQQLPAELDRLGLRRVLVLGTPGQAALVRRVAGLAGARSAGMFAGAVMHVPIEAVRQARAEAGRRAADGLVAIGGGSTTGLAKAVALDAGLPIVAVPTTYAGSEMTAIHGITQDGIKTTGRDPRVLPRTAIYDPELTLALPLALSVTSSFNAMAHAAEALYAPDGNPIVALMAEEGLRACAAALPRLLADPRDLAARADALYGAWLCGTVLGAAAMGLHHKLCHTLGGSFELPHAETHTVLLPHALAYNAAQAPQALARVARALGLPPQADAPLALQDLARRCGAPLALREIGMPAAGLDRAAELAAASPYPNPRPLDRAALRALLQRAWDGAAPQP